jgi:hypothetical protein
MKDSLSGIGSTSFTNLGDIVYVGSAGTTLNSGLSTSKTIVGIATTYRSSKVLVQIGATDSSYYQYDELTVIHDGTNVDLLKYGQLTTNTISRVSSPGIGTYNAYISDSYLNIDFIPYSTLPISYNVSTIRVSISNTSSVGIGSTFLDNNSLSSNWVSIAASTTPVANPITSYNNIIHDNNPAYSSAYYIVSVEDTTNNEYQMSEILIVDDKNNAAGVATTTAYISEFGIVQTNNSLGVFSADVSGTDTILYFTPISDVDVQVRVFQHSLGFSNLDITETSITV